MQEGEECPAVDAHGARYLMRLVRLGRSGCEMEIIPRAAETPAAAELSITLLQCLPKRRKIDLIVRQATEAGVVRIIPLFSENSVVRPGQDDARPPRLRRIAREALQQSGNARLPEIEEPRKLASIVGAGEDWGTALLFHEQPLSTISLHQLLAGRPRVVSMIIGPEGGLSGAGGAASHGSGIPLVHLGGNVLRVETAALYALGAVKTILQERDAWNRCRTSEKNQGSRCARRRHRPRHCRQGHRAAAGQRAAQPDRLSLSAGAPARPPRSRAPALPAGRGARSPGVPGHRAGRPVPGLPGREPFQQLRGHHPHPQRDREDKGIRLHAGLAQGRSGGGQVNLRGSFHGIRVVGRFYGYFPKQAEPDIVTAIKKSSASLVLVGTGVPGKDKWILKHRKELNPGHIAMGGQLLRGVRGQGKAGFEKAPRGGSRRAVRHRPQAVAPGRRVPLSLLSDPSAGVQDLQALTF